jgi:60 kDa SS-A/Ro ribonucleoprotein
MSSLNKTLKQMVANHNGLQVKQISKERQLKRLVLASLMWEDSFYVDGQTNAEAMAELVGSVSQVYAETLAIEARKLHNLRHVPLHILRELARHGKLSNKTLTETISRPDEIGEFLAMYWKDGKTPLSHQVKVGLANSFLKFNEYQFAKHDKNSAAVKLRDAMFMVRPKPATESQTALFKRIANNELVTPDTWEVALSGGADKRETFTRLMAEKKLGALAFLRNLRNMTEAGVSTLEIEQYAQAIDTSKVLPFRYVAAVRAVPALKNMLGRMMIKSLADQPKLSGKTVLLVDVSGSMDGPISIKSDLTCMDAAAALAVLCRGICEEVAIYTFSTRTVKVANKYEGLDLTEAIVKSQPHAGTDLAQAILEVNRAEKYDRLIVFTDEQSSTRPQAPKGLGYIVNVAAYKNGINHGAYTAIDGFSESVIKFISESEKENS